MLTRLRKSVLMKYLLSYSGVVLLCSATIGFFSFYHLMNLRRDAYFNNTQEKMAAVITDIEVQFDMLNDIAMDISISKEFNRRLFSRNKYYELDLLEAFAKYKNYSPFSGDYFMFYHANPELLYLSSGLNDKGSSSVFSYYCAKNLNISGAAALQKRLIAECGRGLLSLGEYGGSGDTILLYYTIYTSGIKDESCKATLCFKVDRTQIEERVMAVSGGFGDRFALYAGEFMLTGPDIEPTTNDNTITLTSEDGSLKLVSDINSDSFYQIILGYERVSTVFFVASAALFLLLAAYVAYRNYRPIQAVLAKYGQSGGASGEFINELDSIDHLLKEARENIMAADRRTVEHMAVLKSQLLLLLLNGVVSEDVVRNLWILQDGLKGPFYGVLCIRVSRGLKEGELSALQADIEDFSDTAVSIYTCTWQGCDWLSGILSTREEDSKEQVVKLIKELCEAKGHSCDIGEGGLYSAIQKLHTSYAEAINNLEMLNEIEKDVGMNLHMAQASRKIRQVFKYIDDHYLDWDMSLNKVAEEFKLNATCLSNTFKQETGINYKAYIIELRMEEAKRLLRDSDMTVMDICQKVGYSNLSHFIKMFKDVVGITPSSYRVNHSSEQITM